MLHDMNMKRRAFLEFVQMPGEEKQFVDFLISMGDIWARAVHDDLREPKWEPLPITQFLERYSAHIHQNHAIDIYFGFREAILNPPEAVFEKTVGGTQVPYVVSGEIIPDAYVAMGGKKITEYRIDTDAADLVLFHQGSIDEAGFLHRSSIHYGTEFLTEFGFVHKSAEFMEWGEKCVTWWIRRAVCSVPVVHYKHEIPATQEAWAAVQQGLKVARISWPFQSRES